MKYCPIVGQQIRRCVDCGICEQEETKGSIEKMDREKLTAMIESEIDVAESHNQCYRAIDLPVLRDILAMLKEQEAKWIYGEDETGVDGWHCSECNFFEPWFYEFTDDIDFIKRYEYCPKCGRRMTSYTGKQKGR